MNLSLNLTGTIAKIKETQTFDSGFQKRTLWLDVTEGSYTQKLAIEFTKEKTSILDQYSAGQQVEVGVNIRGNEWAKEGQDTRRFVNLQGWRISAVQSDTQAPVYDTVIVPPQGYPNGIPMPPGQEADDLPF